MNVKGALNTVGSKVADLIGNMDSIGMKGQKIAAEALGDRLLVKSSKEATEAGTGFIMAKARPGADRLVAGIGGGAEGLMAGAASGAVIGGVAGGIDKDETFVGGMAKGAAIGGGIGGIGGAASGALHINPSLVNNTIVDLATAKEATVGLGKDGLGFIKSKFGR